MWPSTVWTANGPTNERVRRRSIPPTPTSSITPRSGAPATSSMTGSEFVITVAETPRSSSARATW